MSADMVGVALVPYYRQILPILNIFKNMNSEFQPRYDWVLIYGQMVRQYDVSLCFCVAVFV